MFSLTEIFLKMLALNAIFLKLFTTTLQGGSVNFSLPRVPKTNFAQKIFRLHQNSRIVSRKLRKTGDFLLNSPKGP